MAHIKQTSDDISSRNPGYENVIPKRVNAVRAVNTPPLSQPSLRIESVSRRFPNGEEVVRFKEGDTLLISTIHSSMIWVERKICRSHCYLQMQMVGM